MSKICHSCGQELPDSALVCSLCGERLAASNITQNSHTTATPGQSVRAAPSASGTSVPQQTAAPKNQYNSQNPPQPLSRKVLPFVIVVLIIVSGLATWIIYNKKAEPTPDDLLKQVFTISSEQDELSSYSDNALIDTLIIKNATYSIISSDSSSIKLEITAPDMRTLLSGLVDNNITITDANAEYERIIANVIASLECDFPTVTNTVIVDIERVDGTPSLVLNYTFMDAMYGGMLSFFDELMEAGVQS